MVWVDSGTWSSAIRFQGGTDGSSECHKDHCRLSESFDAAVREGLARANKTVRGITGLHVIEHKASVEDGKIEEYRVTMEVTFILEN
jgi:flavin-binding protein dodecin